MAVCACVSECIFLFDSVSCLKIYWPFRRAHIAQPQNHFDWIFFLSFCWFLVVCCMAKKRREEIYISLEWWKKAHQMPFKSHLCGLLTLCVYLSSTVCHFIPICFDLCTNHSHSQYINHPYGNASSFVPRLCSIRSKKLGQWRVFLWKKKTDDNDEIRTVFVMAINLADFATWAIWLIDNQYGVLSLSLDHFRAQNLMMLIILYNHILYRFVFIAPFAVRLNYDRNVNFSISKSNENGICFLHWNQHTTCCENACARALIIHMYVCAVLTHTHSIRRNGMAFATNSKIIFDFYYYRFSVLLVLLLLLVEFALRIGTVWMTYTLWVVSHSS